MQDFTLITSLQFILLGLSYLSKFSASFKMIMLIYILIVLSAFPLHCAIWIFVSELVITKHWSGQGGCGVQSHAMEAWKHSFCDCWWSIYGNAYITWGAQIDLRLQSCMKHSPTGDPISAGQTNRKISYPVIMRGNEGYKQRVINYRERYC